LNKSKKKSNKCLHCKQLIDGEGDFHAECCTEFFGIVKPSLISYSIEQMDALLDKLFFFELSVFSFLKENNDIYLKNFSMLESMLG
jgi:hypothetical protein